MLYEVHSVLYDGLKGASLTFFMAQTNDLYHYSEKVEIMYRVHGNNLQALFGYNFNLSL
jgi:hypothetical protein